MAASVLASLPPCLLARTEAGEDREPGGRSAAGSEPVRTTPRPAFYLGPVRSLARPAFPDDDGRGDESLSRALDQHRRVAAPAAVLSALCRARLLVPVVAVGTSVDRGTDGLARDKEAEMSAVLVRGRDGRRALLVFSSLDRLTGWDADARPVPVAAADAARAAVAEGAAALVVDVAGPVPFAVTGEDLAQLAAGRVLVPAGDGHAWAVVAG